MSNVCLSDIKRKINAEHEGDEKQLEVVFSICPRLLVEAPAGYGKTKTMISRIAYLYATGSIPNPKRILALTFSVNAALKIKREVAEKLPTLLSAQNNPVAVGEKVTITNYHGFCKGILKKYGYLVSDIFRKDINLFRAIGDSDIEKQPALKTGLNQTEMRRLQAVETSIKEANLPDSQTIHEYNEIVVRKLLPLGYITHNSVILFVLEILTKYTEIKNFYQSYYPLIVVDEFQDTNCIAWNLLKSIISDESQLVFLGDPLQRIYGFIGALPNVMSDAIDKYGMSKITLSKNYRFRNNPEMLKLDKNIRANASNCFIPTISDDDVAQLPAFWGATQPDEAGQVVAKAKGLITDGTTKIAVLFRSRGKNAEAIEVELNNNGIPYFYGMFTDDDAEYVDFHNKCQEMFIRRFGKSKVVNRKSLLAFSDSVKTAYSSVSEKTVESLLRLLDALVEKVSIDYSAFIPEDKYILLLDIFENRQLKQAMEYVDSQVILSTVHGAKGLEWDYVILSDVERWVFPGYFICKDCESKHLITNNYRCSLPNPIPVGFIKSALDELSVFYVGITRAKKQVFVSASAQRFDYSGNEKTSALSCLVNIPGVRLIKAQTI